MIDRPYIDFDDGKRIDRILDDLQLPNGDEEWFILLDKENRFVTGKTPIQQVYMGQEISKRVFGDSNERYTLLPVQDSYNLIYQDERFRKIADMFTIPNREIVTYGRSSLDSAIVPDPKVQKGISRWESIDSDKLYYTVLDRPNRKDSINLSLNKDIIEILVRAGVMEEPSKEVLTFDIDFRSDFDPREIEQHRSVSSIVSNWNNDRKCFAVKTVRPTMQYSHWLPVYKKEG